MTTGTGKQKWMEFFYFYVFHYFFSSLPVTMGDLVERDTQTIVSIPKIMTGIFFVNIEVETIKTTRRAEEGEGQIQSFAREIWLGKDRDGPRFGFDQFQGFPP